MPSREGTLAAVGRQTIPEMRSLTGAEWVIRHRAAEALFEALDDLHPLAVQILHNRGYDAPEEIRAFMDGPLPPHDPYLLDGMEPAVARMAEAVGRRERVCVYGDFDVDGVTGVALLVEALTMLGCQAFPYIPERLAEGYGLNPEAVDSIQREGARLIVTADCGANSEAEIARARDYGIDLLVTDHHHAGEPSQLAVAVLNPNQPGEGYPFAGLAGVGVAYKLVQALAEEFPERLPCPEEFLDLVALGTVADLVPLRDENRTFVTEGLEQLRRTHRLGLQALGEAARRPVETATTETISYAYAPRLNAAGRLAHAQLALELLQAGHPVRAEELARHLDELNNERRRLTEDVVDDVQAGIEPDACLVFAVGDDYPPGVTGLAAARLTSATGRPAFVATRVEGQIRGSARAPEGVHLAELLGRHAHLLERWGGHAGAAGFTVRPDRVAALREALGTDLEAPELRGRLGSKVRADCRVYPRTVSFETYRRVVQPLSPYGEGHQSPRFVVENVAVGEARIVGSNHLALRFAEFGPEVEAIWFGHGDARTELNAGRRVDAAFRLDLRAYRGTTRLQMLIDDIRVAPRA